VRSERPRLEAQRTKSGCRVLGEGQSAPPHQLKGLRSAVSSPRGSATPGLRRERVFPAF